MKNLIWGLILTSFPSNISAQTISKEYVKASIKKAAKKVGVPEILLSAICWAESRHTPSAYRHTDGAQGNHAFGICQVLYTTARDLGLPESEGCQRDFGEHLEEKNYQGCPLFGPYTSAYYAAKYLKYQLKRYSGSWISAIAAYNSGTVRICKTGWVYNRGKKLYRCEIGGLLNQVYVDRVLEALAEGR